MGGVSAGHAQHVQARQLVLVGIGLTGSVDGGEGVELLGDRDGVGMGGHRIAVGTGGGEGDEVHVPSVHLVDLVEHVHVGLGGGEPLRVGARRTRDRRRQSARLHLVVDDVDGAGGHAARRRATVRGARGRHAARRAARSARDLEPPRAVVALGPPVVGACLPELGGRGVGDRHRRAPDRLAPGARRAGRRVLVVVHGGRYPGGDEGGHDQHDRVRRAAAEPDLWPRPRGAFGVRVGCRSCGIHLRGRHGGARRARTRRWCPNATAPAGPSRGRPRRPRGIRGHRAGAR